MPPVPRETFGPCLEFRRGSHFLRLSFNDIKRIENIVDKIPDLVRFQRTAKVKLNKSEVLIASHRILVKKI